MQLYANANMIAASSHQQQQQQQQPTNVPGESRFASVRPPLPRVTQSRSIFAHNDKTVYGNPKDIFASPPPKLAPPPPPSPAPPLHVVPPQPSMSNGFHQGGVLDLTRKNEKQQHSSYPRPSLEIVRVPVVPRPNPLNLERKVPKERGTVHEPQANNPAYAPYQKVV